MAHQKLKNSLQKMKARGFAGFTKKCCIFSFPDGIFLGNIPV